MAVVAGFLNYGIAIKGNIKLHNGNKYNISESMINMYTWHLNLTIRHLTKADFGAYSCSSVNALGKSEARIRLQGTYSRSTNILSGASWSICSQSTVLRLSRCVYVLACVCRIVFAWGPHHRITWQYDCV